MKKYFLILLSCLLVISLVSCNDQGNNDGIPEEPSDTVGTAANTTPPEGDGKAETPSPEAEEITVKLNSGAENVLFFGEREALTEHYFTCDRPASGFEMKIKTVGGSLKLRVTSNGSVRFRAWVDGVSQKAFDGSEYFSVSGNRILEFNGLADGEHTFRFFRVSNDTTTATVYDVTFKGEQLSHNMSDRYFIEFLGDEMTAGSMLADGKDDVTKAYSYLAADKLSADYSVTAIENAGFSTNDPTDLYGREELKRNADMVIVQVGRYDLAAKMDVEEFVAAYKSLILKVKGLNEMCKVLCLLTLDNSEYNEAVKNLLNERGGNELGYYYFEPEIKTNGAYTAAQHGAVAEQLSAYIAQIKDAPVLKLQLKDGGVGTGDIIDYDDAGAWMPVA